MKASVRGWPENFSTLAVQDGSLAAQRLKPHHPMPLALAENAQTRKHSAVRAAGEFELFRKFDWPFIYYRGNL